MMTTDITIEIECESCGNGLDATYNKKTNVLNVAPCKTCLDASHEAGISDGRKEKE